MGSTCDTNPCLVLGAGLASSVSSYSVPPCTSFYTPKGLIEASDKVGEWTFKVVFVPQGNQTTAVMNVTLSIGARTYHEQAH